MVRLKELRQKAGITQRTLAARLGINQGEVSQWENNKRVPGLKWLLPIAAILGCEVRDLFPDPSKFIK